jgi:predicted nucleotidyltransferase
VHPESRGVENVAARQHAGQILAIAGRYAEVLGQNLRLVRLYVYGSHTTGDQDDGSDIDIAVVSYCFSGDLIEDALWLMKLRREIDLRIEPHPFLPSEFTEENPMAREVLRTGIRIV